MNFSIDEGLPSSTVYRAIQDKDGYIWFATEGGVCRFDGSEFETFTHTDGLTSNDVLDIFEDRWGRIWFLAYCRELGYWQDGRFHNSGTDPWLKKIQARDFMANHLEMKDGTLVFCDEKGSFWELSDKNEAKELGKMGQNEARPFYAMFEYPEGRPVALTNNTLLEVRTKVRLDTFVGPLNRWIPQRLATIGQDTHLVGISDNFLLVTKGQARMLEVEGLEIAPDILFLQTGKHGDLWVSTRDGAVHVTDFRIEGNKLVVGEWERWLEGRSVTSVLEDHEGNYWLTTNNDGVFFYPSIATRCYFGENDRGQQFANRVHFDSRGKVWVGFDRSLVGKLDDGGWKWMEFKHGWGSRGRTNSIYEDSKGTVFVVMDGAIHIEALDGRKFDISSGGKSILEVKDGFYLLSHSGRVDTLRMDRLEEFDGKFARLRKDTTGFYDKRCLSMVADGAGNAYIGTLQGLLKWDGQRLSKVDLVPSEPISCVKIAPDGKLWCSSLSSGVGFLDDEGYVAITVADGLVSDICHRISFDHNGVVYVATNRGISRLVMGKGRGKEGMQVFNFGRNYGIASDEVRDIAVGNGNLYLATDKGLSVLRDDFFMDTVPQMPLYVTRIAVGGQALDWRGGKVVLPASTKQLSISYKAICFRNAALVQYAYRLGTEDSPGEWIATPGRQLEFPALRAGDYRLEIKAMVKSHPNSASQVVLELEVLPAFWETWWFYLLAGLGMLSVVGLVFYLAWHRVRTQERRRAEIVRKIAEAEQKALRAQMNPHFIFNSLNSIEHFFITGRPEEANAFIADFSDLMRSILDLSGKSAIDLQEELRFVGLFLSLESHRMDHKFTYAVKVDPGLDLDSCMVPPMLLQPFAENSVWHGVAPLVGREGHIELRAEAADGGTLLIVEDNGIGRTRSEELKARYRKKHKSSGVRITQERLSLLNMNLAGEHLFTLEIVDLQAEDGTPCGTRVSLFIPHSFNQ